MKAITDLSGQEFLEDVLPFSGQMRGVAMVQPVQGSLRYLLLTISYRLRHYEELVKEIGFVIRDGLPESQSVQEWAQSLLDELEAKAR